MRAIMVLVLALPVLAHAAQDKTPAPDWPLKQIGPSGDAFDRDYAWDAFIHRGRMVWACRGVQTGDFVDPAYCASKEKVDSHWPDKATPPNWKE